jgi:ABC-type transport system involved in multi-copper enzyme maturation permease subunit
MRSLLWKEWHEQSWKLAFSCILLGAMAAIGLHARMIADQDMLVWIWAIGIILPISYSSGLIPAERSDGFFESLIVLPVAPWKILLAKTVMGLALCIFPLLLAGLITLAIAGGRELTDQTIIAIYFRTILTSLSLFIWMFAWTSRLPTEARSGLVGIGILICWLMISVGLSVNRDESLWAATSPLAFVDGYLGDQIALMPVGTTSVLIQALIGVTLWIWTSRQIAHSVKD